MSKLTDVEYSAACAWLRQQQGTWRLDTEAGAPVIVANVGNAEGRAAPAGDSEPSIRIALTAAINHLRRYISDAAILAAPPTVPPIDEKK